MSGVRGKAKIGAAPTVAALAKRACRQRKRLGATRIHLDVDEEVKQWLVDQGLLGQWSEDDREEIARALKLALQGILRKKQRVIK